ncbi:hypothetical protein [Flavivirga aquatica]|nr:hypothetical protein [Flavivirga aquatica]
MKNTLFFLGFVVLTLNLNSCTEASFDEEMQEDFHQKIDGDEITEDDV